MKPREINLAAQSRLNVDEDRSEAQVGQKRTFEHIGDLGFAFIGEMLGVNALNNLPGRGGAVLDFAANEFRARGAALGMSPQQLDKAFEDVEEQYRKGARECESPIERDTLAALLTARWHEAFATMPPKVHIPGVDPIVPAGDLVIVPQMAFVRFRVDFMVMALVGDRRQMMAIECDGNEHHADKAKDILRDGYLASWGIPTFRAAGKDIYADPHLAISEAVNSLNEWRCRQ